MRHGSLDARRLLESFRVGAMDKRRPRNRRKNVRIMVAMIIWALSDVFFPDFLLNVLGTLDIREQLCVDALDCCCLTCGC